MRITPLEQWIASKCGAGFPACRQEAAGSRETGGARLTREAIHSYQLRKLRETIAWARARGPFYREHLAGIPEGAPARLEDLSRLPFTTPDDIREAPLRFLCVSQGEIDRVVTLQTSGTTGNPKRVFFTREDQELTIDFFHHGMTTLSDPGDRVLILLPGERPGSVGDLLALGLERAGVAGIRHGFVENAARAVSVMEKEGINTLVGLPVHVLGLAEAGGTYSPGNVLLSADYVPDSLSRRLVSKWNCGVYTHYGMTEMGYGGGVECDARSGYHLREADLYFEIVAPQTGEPVRPGEWGEIVFTTLTRGGMPLIRYRTGDISRFVPEPCQCGTVLKTMARIRRRADGDIALANGLVLNMADVDEALFAIEGLLDFTAVIGAGGHGDCLQIRVRTSETAAGGVERAVLDALDTIPAVLSARRLGVLDVGADVDPGVGRPVGSAAKRAIIDGRS
ncbi:MAG: DVU_1553 family AMP-dependent CoA ligase [Syntrophobacter sp.]